ncbi:MAG: NAD(P)H-binding protein [Opitutales bacterium]|jgi:nucleoside-diphosphate-sugar epimerase
MDRVKKVALAGASGFVGTALRMALADQYDWIGLTRSETVGEQGKAEAHTEWRQCDLFSLPQVRQAMEGAEIAVYMVHSMLPSSRLVQGNFADMDLLLADNFIRAAEEAGVKRVVYIGGLIPENEPHLSPHLASRLEVESVLKGRSLPVTVLRAGLIFGPGGSSAQMLLNLSRRLPVMILPAWTRNTTQSIDIKDIVRALEIVLRDDSYTGTYDLGGHEPMSYKDMILRTGKVLGHETASINIPANLVMLSRRWVSLFGSTSANLVNPLLESLRHSLVARPNRLLAQIQPGALSFEKSVRSAVDDKGYPLPNPRQSTQKLDNRQIHYAKRVRSIQRMPLPGGWSAIKLSKTYSKWISRASRGIIQEHRDEKGILRLSFISRKCLILELTPTPFAVNCEYRRAYYVTGGFLAHKSDPPGRFELRIFPSLGCLVAAIHGYQPRLPWWLYSFTQALVHLAVMRAFGRFLGKQCGDSFPE